MGIGFFFVVGALEVTSLRPELGPCDRSIGRATPKESGFGSRKGRNERRLKDVIASRENDWICVSCFSRHSH